MRGLHARSYGGPFTLRAHASIPLGSRSSFCKYCRPHKGLRSNHYVCNAPFYGLTAAHLPSAMCMQWRMQDRRSAAVIRTMGCRSPLELTLHSLYWPMHYDGATQFNWSSSPCKSLRKITHAAMGCSKLIAGCSPFASRAHTRILQD
jgi:hypothetical protein